MSVPVTCAEPPGVAVTGVRDSTSTPPLPPGAKMNAVGLSSCPTVLTRVTCCPTNCCALTGAFPTVGWGDAGAGAFCRCPPPRAVSTSADDAATAISAARVVGLVAPIVTSSSPRISSRAALPTPGVGKLGGAMRAAARAGRSLANGEPSAYAMHRLRTASRH
jgi:hypothetical protein